MNHRTATFFRLVLALAILAPIAAAQKPPAPSPNPQPPTNPNHPGTSPNTPTSPTGPPDTDIVQFLLGKVFTGDSTPLPNDMLVERVCNGKVRQQVYASSRGDFSMQMGSMTDSFLDATGEQSSSVNPVSTNHTANGIPRRDLANCELRASAPGFRANSIQLVDLDAFGNTVDVGKIFVERTSKVEGATLNAAPYKAPKNAREAYEKGIQAEKRDKLPVARQYFEQAVKLYPTFATAWYELGNVLQKQDQPEAARTAYVKATTTDANFLPAYLSLALLACKAQDWPQVLTITANIIDHDQLNRADTSDFVLDLDPFNYAAAAYFYNSLANFHLNNILASEKSARQAERLDLRTRFPQLHLVLADIFTKKNQNEAAIAEIQTYLALVPNTKDAEQLRTRIASLTQPAAATPQNP